MPRDIGDVSTIGEVTADYLVRIVDNPNSDYPVEKLIPGAELTPAAAGVSVTDTAGYYTGTNVETVLAELVTQFRPTRFVSLGDSISSDNGYIWNATARPDPSVYAGNWHWYAQLLADSRAIYAGSFGLASQTIAQIKATYLPLLLAASPRPQMCVVLMGQNDIASVTATTLTDYTSVVDSLIGAGITPILCTLTPGNTVQGFHKLNAHIRALATARRLNVCDLTTALTDSATGSWLSALTRDAGTHQNEAGAKVMGQALATTLTDMVPHNSMTAWLARCNAGYGLSRTTDTGGLSNPIFLTDDGGTPTYPSPGWSVVSGYAAGTSSLATPGGDVAGRAWTITRKLGTDLRARASCATGAGGVVAGDRLLIAFRLSTTVAGVGGGFGFDVLSPAGVNWYDRGGNSAYQITVDLASHLFAVEVTAPTTESSFLFDFFLNGANDATATISELTILNLTGLGVTV